MSTYEDLRSRIEVDINRTDITAQVQQQIKLAIKHYGTFPFWFNEARTTLTASSSASFLTVPSDYLDIVELYINVGNYPIRMDQKPLNEIIEFRPPSESQPGCYAYFADRFELDYKVNQEYTFPLWYIKEPAALPGASGTGLWASQGEGLIVYRAEKILYSRVLKNQTEASACGV